MCVWKPEIVRGLPAWPTTSTALPTRTDTGSGCRLSSSVIRKRGRIAALRKYSIQCVRSSTTAVSISPHGIRTATCIGKRDERRKQARDRRIAIQLPVRVVRVDANEALAHVHETLRDAHDKQAVGLLVVVARKLAQPLRKARIVRALSLIHI